MSISACPIADSKATLVCTAACKQQRLAWSNMTSRQAHSICPLPITPHKVGAVNDTTRGLTLTHIIAYQALQHELCQLHKHSSPTSNPQWPSLTLGLLRTSIAPPRRSVTAPLSPPLQCHWCVPCSRVPETASFADHNKMCEMQKACRHASKTFTA